MPSDKPRVNQGYVLRQFARALETEALHPDAATRGRARERVRQWSSVLKGLSEGTLRVGSRAPVAGVPTWVTPEVVRGGFATGRAAASGELSEGERSLITSAGLAPTRDAVFAHALTPGGAAHLLELADSGRFRATVPEETALMVVAWLVEHGDHDAADAVVRELAPWRAALRFVPLPASEPPAPDGIVTRASVAEVRDRLARVAVPPALEVAHAVATVWNPLRGDFVALWLDGLRSGLDAPWTVRARALLERHADLVARVGNRGRHARPGSNLDILVTATRWAVEGQPERAAARVRRPVADVVARRGTPGSPEHRAAQAEQLAFAQRPTHADFARIVADRLGTVPQQRGVEDPAAYCGPVAPHESTEALAVGQPIPQPIVALVERAREGTPEELLDRGIIGSAESLAALTPEVTADVVTAVFRDPQLRSIMRANYLAFRGRRSLLLLDLEHQVRLDELPWVQAASAHRAGPPGGASAQRALKRLAELTLRFFPATLVPNPMLTELGALAREAGTPLPFVEELAADIFMGTFSAKFLAAAQRAGAMLDGSVYARYYGIDYPAIRALPTPTRKGPVTTSKVFDELCMDRAGRQAARSRNVAGSGAVIEQAQILTTQNLATLTGPEVDVDLDWASLAAGAVDRALLLAGRLERNPRPLRTVKDIAYAWRQALFFLSRVPADQQVMAGRALAAAHAASSSRVRDRMAPVFLGLRDVLQGTEFDASGRSPSGGRRLYGWVADGPHWLLDGPER